MLKVSISHLEKKNTHLTYLSIYLYIYILILTRKNFIAYTELGTLSSKSKIVIATGQIFSYFSIVYDVPWPKFTLLVWEQMQLFSFDIYAVFGEYDCRMQTTFLQKFYLHMYLPILLFTCIWVAFAFAYLRLKCCCTKNRRRHLAKNNTCGVGKWCARICVPLFTLESAKTTMYFLLNTLFFNMYM